MKQGDHPHIHHRDDVAAGLEIERPFGLVRPSLGRSPESESWLSPIPPARQREVRMKGTRIERNGEPFAARDNCLVHRDEILDAGLNAQPQGAWCTARWEHTESAKLESKWTPVNLLLHRADERCDALVRHLAHEHQGQMQMFWSHPPQRC